MPRVTFQCNRSLVLHVSEIFFFTNLKFWPSFKRLPTPPEIKKIDFSNMWKRFYIKLVGLFRMLAVTFQCNPTQINRCKKKLFFWQITTFAPRLQGAVCTCWKKLKIIDFSNMWKKCSIKIGELVETDYTYFPA